VRAAQKGIPTGSVYDTNEKNLARVGPTALRKMLETRQWEGLDGKEWEPHQTREMIEANAQGQGFE